MSVCNHFPLKWASYLCKHVPHWGKELGKPLFHFSSLCTCTTTVFNAVSHSCCLCFGRYFVYSRSWADLPPEAPWSLKWSELIYLCLLLRLYLLLVLTIKILTTFSNVDGSFFSLSYSILPTQSWNLSMINLIFWNTIAFLLYLFNINFFAAHSILLFLSPFITLGLNRLATNS